MASIVLLASVCRLSLSVTNTAGEQVGRSPDVWCSAAVGSGAWSLRQLIVHGGPVRLRPVRRAPCYIL